VCCWPRVLPSRALHLLRPHALCKETATHGPLPIYAPEQGLMHNPPLVLRRGNHARISQALADIGVETEKQDADLRTEMAYGMFDTRGKVCKKSAEKYRCRI